MLFRDRLVVASGVSVVLLLGLSGWLLFGGRGASGNEPEKHFTHMHCSACKEETAYDARAAGQTCATCGAGTYVPTVGTMDEAEESVSTTGKAWMYLLLAAVLLQGFGYLAVSRWRGLRRAAEEFHNRMLVCRCPFCERKIGYRAPRAGEGVVCPRCKTAFALPAA
jgi:hypothetical protein